MYGVISRQDEQSGFWAQDFFYSLRFEPLSRNRLVRLVLKFHLRITLWTLPNTAASPLTTRSPENHSAERLLAVLPFIQITLTSCTFAGGARTPPAVER